MADAKIRTIHVQWHSSNTTEIGQCDIPFSECPDYSKLFIALCKRIDLTKFSSWAPYFRSGDPKRLGKFKLVTFEKSKRDVPNIWLKSPDEYDAYIKGVTPQTQVCLEVLTWRGARPGPVPFIPKIPFNARGQLSPLDYLKLLVEAKIHDDVDEKPITDLRLRGLVDYIKDHPSGQFIPSKRPQVISLEGDHTNKLNIVYIEELFDNAIIDNYDIFRFIRFQSNSGVQKRTGVFNRSLSGDT
ncbi:hypothetical protein B0T26DRAFT_672883 [Lasiosphaeria miniovina]|uniref:Uncharacterized protein n=1 Tax=Lasiosphaeria miniovina TaxID=1954250 RepID=A0AA40B622_9PEZI|nr:uncharacterized protein B0T26DRAFT_672883 [Lasiosphaeria miniovina]KAK0728337.1 hypothetical protein B0T26DRAFT_672883 [Lasiosphaeria miniovina]